MRKRRLRISGSEALACSGIRTAPGAHGTSRRVFNVQQIPDELELSQPTVTSHVQRLAEAGLIATNFKWGQRGTQTACSSLYDEITLVSTPRESASSSHSLDLTMPLGAYTDHEVSPTCGLAHGGSNIGLLDNPETFHFPERMKAEILWFARGYVEFTVAPTLPPL